MHTYRHVILENNVSVWFNAVVRGNDVITPGENSQQDGCVLHTDEGFPLTLGKSHSRPHVHAARLHHRRWAP